MELETLAAQSRDVPESQLDKLLDQLVDKLLEPPSKKSTDGLKAYLDQHSFSDKVSSAQPTPKPNDWTVFVNLSGNHLVNNAGLRIDNELQDGKLVASTRNKPITIIVQTAVNNDSQRNGLTPPFNNSVQDHLMIPDLGDISVVTYEIANGQKRLLSSGPSKGAAADLRGLLTSDPSSLNAKHIMLINEAHGAGMLGLQGDTGNMSTQELKSAITDTMSVAGKSSVDVLDLLSCEMANLQALNGVAGAANLIVASEFPEFSNPVRDNLQPIAQPIARLIEHTESSSIDVTKSVEKTNTELCRAGALERFIPGLNKDHRLCGADTLGVYDATSLPLLNAKLNQLGKVLMDSAGDAKNKATIDSIVSNLPTVFVSPDFGTWQRYISDQQHKDLGMFLNAVDRALQHDLRDTTGGAIADAVKGVRQAMSKVVMDHFNATALGLGLPAALEAQGLPSRPVSGLSVMLPSDYAKYKDRVADGAAQMLKFNVEDVERSFEDAFYDRKVWNSTTLRDSLARETKPLMELASNSQAPEAKVFVIMATAFDTWLGSADKRPIGDKYVDYYGRKLAYNEALSAWLKTAEVQDSVGLVAARKFSAAALKQDSVPMLSDWNRFTTLLAHQ